MARRSSAAQGGCWRKAAKCSRSVVLVGILALGLLLVKDRYDRIDDLMPGALDRSPGDRGAPGDAAGAGLGASAAVVARPVVAVSDVGGEEDGESIGRAAILEAQLQRLRSPKAAALSPSTTPPLTTTTLAPQRPRRPSAGKGGVRGFGAGAAAGADGGEGGGGGGHGEEDREPATAVEDTKEIREMRQGLQAWLLRVATFHQVEVMGILQRWLLSAPSEEVAEELDKLLEKDSDSGWTTCAIEDEQCLCPSAKIRYGHVEKRWIKMDGKVKIWCSLGTFGGKDVAVGMLKQCQCWQGIGRDAGAAELRAAAATLAADEAEGARKGVGATLSAWWHRLLASLEHRRSAPSAARSEDASSPGRAVPSPPPPSEYSSLWQHVGEVAKWYSEEASADQLASAARVYKWLDNTADSAKIGVALSKASAAVIRQSKRKCPGNQEPTPSLAEQRCPGSGEFFCWASCSKEPPLEAARKHFAALAAESGGPDEPGPRSEICSSGLALELLWSCDKKASRIPPEWHTHGEAQFVLDKATEQVCEDKIQGEQMSVYLECDFLDNYLHWTNDESEWIEEAFVTYVGGRKGASYEWQATNLIRSVDVFSTRPIVVVIFGDEFVPPASWRTLRSVIVYRMHPGIAVVSFNFNKLRAMVSSRILYGVQLDVDQLVARGVDSMFEGTKREITDRYPWIMLPVHWMSRENIKGTPYQEYAFTGWQGTRSMRWGHAHPTWSYWALAFLSDMLAERWRAAFRIGNQKIKVWKLEEAKEKGLIEVLSQGLREDREARSKPFMSEDEDMFNVGLWRDSAWKDWCKFDLEWGLFKDRLAMERDLYWDKKWYPKGLPVLFVSMHNTKQFESTDWLLSILSKCDKERPNLKCPSGQGAPRYCQAGSTDERKWRDRPAKYISTICCCFEPREKTIIYWAGKWFKSADEVPMRLPHMDQDRTCTLP